MALSGTPVEGAVVAWPTEATVARIDFGSVHLLADDGRTRPAGVPARLRGPKKSLGNMVVTGDRVTIGFEGEQAQVESIAPRRNAFSRRAAGEREVEQVVASNLDQVCIVASLLRPEFKHGLVDRVLVQCARAGIAARLVLNKTDLEEANEVASILHEYEFAGVAGHATCALTRRGVDELAAACKGRRTLFVGHSGVGKSTLLHALMPHEDIAQGEVNEVTGKGRHTTTAAVLYRPEPGTEVIDTPGVRAFALWNVDAEDLAEYYPELAPLMGGCRFGDCRHDREPGCALRMAVANGTVGERRFASYCKLRDELAEGHY